jgi:23S rRNA pseudouridine955/2504/2580 synthase
MLSFPVTIVDHGRRMDSFIRNLLPAAPASYLHQLLKRESVAVNGAPASPELLLRISDAVALKESSRTQTFLSGKMDGIDILYENDRIVVFNKRPGLPVHRSAELGGHNLVDLGIQALARRGTVLKLYPVNRLDRETSGGVVMAKSSTQAGIFGRLFQEGLVEKRYLAIVAGRTEPEGVIDIPLDEKESRSEYRALFTGKGVTVLSVTPVTGRSHQIRRHLAAIGSPVVGDRRYGGKKVRDMEGHALHSYRLAFPAPDTGQELRIFAPLQEQFSGYLGRILGQEIVPFLDSLIAI